MCSLVVPIGETESSSVTQVDNEVTKDDVINSGPDDRPSNGYRRTWTQHKQHSVGTGHYDALLRHTRIAPFSAEPS